MTKHATEQLLITEVIAPAAMQVENLSQTQEAGPQAASAAVNKGSPYPSYEDDPVDDNFFGLDSDCLVVSEQAAIAVYQNRRGDIAIRQARAWCEDEDRLIFVNPANLEKLIQALQAHLPR